ncbi:MAG: helix-turn-helix transcriptional regulator [Chloroflexi bacterium]|nr:helix-turn-helix transcriptional regulator [Chloroflexota bacterium]
MVKNGAAALDRVFRALASQPRREMLRRVAGERHTVTQLAEHFDMSLAAVAKHIHVLEAAGLVTQTRQGRLHWCRLNPAPLEPARASIDELHGFWHTQLDGLEGFLSAPGNTRSETARGASREKKRRRV